MNDLIVWFARLWGKMEAFIAQEHGSDAAEPMQMLSSEELYETLSAWAEEFEKGDEEDSVIFFERKVEEKFGY